MKVIFRSNQHIRLREMQIKFGGSGKATKL